MTLIDPDLAECLDRLLAELLALRNPQDTSPCVGRLAPVKERLHGGSRLPRAGWKCEDSAVLSSSGAEDLKQGSAQLILEVFERWKRMKWLDVELVRRGRVACHANEDEGEPKDPDEMGRPPL